MGPEAINNFFRDGDVEIYNDQEVLSVSTATREKKIATAQNAGTLTLKGHDKQSNNYSSNRSTYYGDQNTKAAASASRMSSAKGHGGQSLKIFSNSLNASKTRPQTSYGSKFAT